LAWGDVTKHTGKDYKFVTVLTLGTESFKTVECHRCVPGKVHTQSNYILRYYIELRDEMIL